MLFSFLVWQQSSFDVVVVVVVIVKVCRRSLTLSFLLTSSSVCLSVSFLIWPAIFNPEVCGRNAWNKRSVSTIIVTSLSSGNLLLSSVCVCVCVCVSLSLSLSLSLIFSSLSSRTSYRSIIDKLTLALSRFVRYPVSVFCSLIMWLDFTRFSSWMHGRIDFESISM